MLRDLPRNVLTAAAPGDAANHAESEAATHVRILQEQTDSSQLIEEVSLQQDNVTRFELVPQDFVRVVNVFDARVRAASRPACARLLR